MERVTGFESRLPAEVRAALARGATVLTANQRAARTLRQAFDRDQREQGLLQWEPPPILAWDAWTAAVWARLVLEGHRTEMLLNRTQEHALWQSILADDEDWSRLVEADALAEMAAEAWSRLCAYRGETRLRSAGVSADTRAFARWATEFQARCRAEGYLAAGQMVEALLRAVAAGQAALSADRYVLVGFDGWTPAQEALAEAVRRSGVEFARLELALDGERTIAAAEDGRDELACCARWLRERLEDNPQTRLALIVPGLESHRAEIDRALRRVLAPELEEITASGQPPFEFSLGVPLSRTAMGAAGLDVLRWAVGPLPMERVSALLLSPYVAEGAEMQARAEFDAYVLRRTRMLRPEFGLEAMVRLVERARPFRRDNSSVADNAKDGAPDGIAAAVRLARLLAALKAMRRVAAIEGFAEARLRAHADWAEAMRAVLAAAGWGTGGSSVEFQTRQRWEGVLDEFATLDFTGVRVNAREALAAVQRLARQTLFAPESRDAPVQVMGPLESAGSVFDGVWFLGTSELGWPVWPGASPLLPWPLQLELGMPGADRARDEFYARRVTERIAGSGAAVVFSYARQGEEGPQRASRMVMGVLGERVVAARELVADEETWPMVELETVDEEVSLPMLPDRVIRGGAGLLKAQAMCGFRAFAEQRLWSSSLETRETGMDARERGSAVHVALEIFWKQVRSQAELKALTTEERRGVLGGAVEVALAKTAGREDSEWDVAYVAVQRERLLALLDAWLLKEMERAVPFAVKASETELPDAHIGPLRLMLRVDRVDETEFGDVIVDYKTGAANHKDWLSERPDEPQLPLYAVLADSEELAGVAFGQVRAGKDMGLHGYQSQPGVLLKGAKLQAASLEEQVAQWRECLTALAKDFHRGDVRVRPKSYPHTCEFCEQRLLCRLDVSLLEAGAGDDTDDATEDERG